MSRQTEYISCSLRPISHFELSHTLDNRNFIDRISSFTYIAQVNVKSSQCVIIIFIISLLNAFCEKFSNKAFTYVFVHKIRPN